MAAPVKLLLAWLSLPIASSWAAPLVDPTLPPNVPTPDQAAAAPAPTLQFTLRRPDDTFSALLAGRWIRAGDSFELNGSMFRVERITATSVSLLRGEQREVFEMSPQAAQAVRCRASADNGSCR